MARRVAIIRDLHPLQVGDRGTVLREDGPLVSWDKHGVIAVRECDLETVGEDQAGSIEPAETE